METLAAETLLFERFRLERSAGRLLKQDENGAWQPVAIGSRAFDVLAVLAERPGQHVSRGEIMAAAWPGVVVEDSNLAVQIAGLRRILDRDRSDGSCIQTVPGRGARAHLAADFALTGNAERAGAELAAARRMNPHLFSSLAGLRARHGRVPKVEALFDATYFAGLRKAGMPER